MTARKLISATICSVHMERFHASLKDGNGGGRFIKGHKPTFIDIASRIMIGYRLPGASSMAEDSAAGAPLLEYRLMPDAVYIFDRRSSTWFTATSNGEPGTEISDLETISKIARKSFAITKAGALSLIEAVEAESC